MAISPRLLAPILARPQEDGPRLAAADALTSDPGRAEFIRLQVRRAAAERAFDDRQLGVLLSEESRLERPDFDDGVRSLGVEVTLRRGFVQHVIADAGVFIMRAAAIRAAAPVLELSLSRAELHLDLLFGTELLNGIASLDLTSSRLGDAGVRALANSPYLQDLRWLDLRWNGVSRAGLDALCRSPLVSRLRWLNVSGPDFSAPHDEPIDEDGRLVDFQSTDLGLELESLHGPQPWMHYHPRRLRFFPPSMGQFIAE